MLGSLTQYRRLLNEHVFNPDPAQAMAYADANSSNNRKAQSPKLPPLGHGIAGYLAGETVSFMAAPIEHVKARLQIQYSARKAERLYSGPVDCSLKLVRTAVE